MKTSTHGGYQVAVTFNHDGFYVYVITRLGVRIKSWLSFETVAQAEQDARELIDDLNGAPS